MKYVGTLITVSLFIMLASCGGGGDNNQRGQRDGKPGNDATVVKATPIEVVDLKLGDIGSYILLNTTVETEKMIDIYSQASGFVSKIVAEVGQRVRKGQIIVELDARELRIARDKARVNFEQKQKEYNRFTKTSNKSVLSKEEIETIEFQYKSAKLDYEKAELDYQYAFIKAPISGVISARDVKIGQRIQQGSKVYQMVNLDERIAVVQVPERELNVVKVGQPVKVFSDVLKDDSGNPLELTGRVKRVAPVVDPNSGTYEVVVDLRGNRQLRPGMFINVRIQTDLHRNTLLVPKSTLVYENENKFVFAVRDSVVEKIRVETGYEDDRFVEALNKNLADTDQLVVLGKEGLKDQAKVTVVKNQSRPENTERVVDAKDSTDSVQKSQ